MELNKEQKIKTLKEMLANPIFSGYLGRKGLAIDVLTRRYTFPNEFIDKHLATDYSLLNEYYARFKENNVEKQVKKY